MLSANIIGNTISSRVGEIRTVPRVMLFQKYGNGLGIGRLFIETYETQTLTIDGEGLFYTDSAATLNPSTSIELTAGGLRYIYFRLPNGDATMTFQSALYKFGTLTTNYGYSNYHAGNGPRLLRFDLDLFPELYEVVAGSSETWMYGTMPPNTRYMVADGSGTAWYEGTAVLNDILVRFVANSGGTESKMDVAITGTFPDSCRYIRLIGNLVYYTGAQAALPSLLESLIISSTNVDFVTLDASGTRPITAGNFNLDNWRNVKITSADMVTFLNSITNRVGDVSGTVYINDYADYAAPPVEVTDAVAALIAAKSATAVTLGA